MHKILVIEDDPAIAKGLTVSLKAENYEVIHRADGEKGYQTAQNEPFDLILLDLVLPGRNGEDVCSGLRALGNMTPILMLTSKKDETDKISGLELGADDYVTKPFSLPELHARIRALLRRRPEMTLEAETYKFGDIFVDMKRTEVKKKKEQVHLSRREF